MPIIVKIGEDKTHLSDLLAKVEAGEEVIIQRGDEPVARLTRIRRDHDVRAAIADIFTARVGLAPTTTNEIRAWKREGQR
jgi:antitoxin (DNA-binding transcriptional repressor) of toxin-antitoxin stability system